MTKKTDVATVCVAVLATLLGVLCFWGTYDPETLFALIN